MANPDASENPTPSSRPFVVRFGLAVLLALLAMGVAHWRGLPMSGPSLAVCCAVGASAISALLTLRALRRSMRAMVNAVAIGALLRMALLVAVALLTSRLGGNVLAACAFFLGPILLLRANEILLVRGASLPAGTPPAPPSTSLPEHLS